MRPTAEHFGDAEAVAASSSPIGDTAIPAFGADPRTLVATRTPWVNEGAQT